MGIYRYPDQIEYVIDNVSRFQPIQAIWKTMINVGTTQSMTNAGMRAQLALLQSGIGFQYARLESVLTDQSIPMMADGKCNFISCPLPFFPYSTTSSAIGKIKSGVP